MKRRIARLCLIALFAVAVALPASGCDSLTDYLEDLPLDSYVGWESMIPSESSDTTEAEQLPNPSDTEDLTESDVSDSTAESDELPESEETLAPLETLDSPETLESTEPPESNREPESEEALPTTETETRPDTLPTETAVETFVESLPPETTPETLPETTPEMQSPFYPHIPVEQENRAPTWNEEGYIGGSICASCGRILREEHTLPALCTTGAQYGYESLGKEKKGKQLQKLYEALDELVVSFHNDPTADADAENMIGSINYADLGLSCEQAQMVWTTYRSDHPLYYWIANTVAWSQKKLYIVTDPAYADGDARAEYNQFIAEELTRLMATLYDELDSRYGVVDTAYATAKFFHDTILRNMDYAYTDDGVTPVNALWAHNILGYFEKHEGVCESYARTYQLLLNYCGVQNVLVCGLANGGGHAWNLFRTGAGGWYWADLTWDDVPEHPNGFVYDYFCINDASRVNFLSSHTPFTPNESGIHYQYPLPERAYLPYIASDLFPFAA